MAQGASKSSERTGSGAGERRTWAKFKIMYRHDNNILNKLNGSSDLNGILLTIILRIWVIYEFMIRRHAEPLSQRLILFLL